MGETQVKITEGKVPFKYHNLPKPCETWYRIYGDLKSSSTGRPLIMLHGGPGMTHKYLLSIAEIASRHGIATIFYDQLGCGNSTRLKEKRLDTSFWNVDLFMAEFDNLVEHLGLDSFDALGQSWGGMLLASIAIRGHTGLNKIVIANSPAAMDLWLRGCDQFRKDLPTEVENALQKHEKAQTYDDPDYVKAVMFFYERHLCRVVPFPKHVQDTLDGMEEDNTVYFTM